MKLLILLTLGLSNMYFKELQTDLLENYSTSNIPNKEINTIYLRLGIAIRAINNINQIDGTVTSNVWLRYYWNDNYLTWNPSDYRNITQVIMTTDPSLEKSIWTPDIYLYNTAEKPLENLDYSHAVVNNNGDVFWSRPGLITSTCSFDLALFPYDTQNCYLKFGSWVYNKENLNLTQYSDSIDFDNYQENDGWKIIANSTVYSEQKYSCCPDLYPDLKFYYTLRRKAGFYNINIVVPTFATAFLMIISLFIPWNSGERISFAVTVMLSIIVFLLILSDNLPKTDTIPLLSFMLLGLTIFSLVIVFFTVIITAMHYYKPEKDDYIIKIINKICELNCKARQTITHTFSRTNSYLFAINNQDNLCITNSEDCEKYANKVESWFTFIFTLSFIIYSAAIFSMIPDYNVINAINHTHSFS